MKTGNEYKKYKVVLHVEYTVDATNEDHAWIKALSRYNYERAGCPAGNTKLNSYENFSKGEGI